MFNTFIKIKGAEKIIGGYNPIVWLSTSKWIWSKTNGSFIFSFKNKENFIKDAIISKVKDADHALQCYNGAGPAFEVFQIVKNDCSMVRSV